MRISGKQRYSNIACAGLAAAVLGLAMAPVASYAQNSTAAYGAEAAASSDADVATRVKQALASDQVLDSRHIDVSVEHGHVVLKGFVQDSRALLAASQVATKAAGDRKVVNHISVKQNYPNAP